MFFRSPVSSCLVPCVHCVKIEGKVEIPGSKPHKAPITDANGPQESPNHCSVFALKRKLCFLNSFGHASSQKSALIVLHKAYNACSNLILKLGSINVEVDHAWCLWGWRCQPLEFSHSDFGNIEIIRPRSPIFKRRMLNFLPKPLHSGEINLCCMWMRKKIY